MEVSFEEVAYTVNETAGSLSVCVEITGLLERNIAVNISTANDEALGKKFLKCITATFCCMFPNDDHAFLIQGP